MLCVFNLLKYAVCILLRFSLLFSLTLRFPLVSRIIARGCGAFLSQSVTVIPEVVASFAWVNSVAGMFLPMSSEAHVPASLGWTTVGIGVLGKGYVNLLLLQLGKLRLRERIHLLWFR